MNERSFKRSGITLAVCLVLGVTSTGRLEKETDREKSTQYSR
jgi:hypothetical protein